MAKKTPAAPIDTPQPDELLTMTKPDHAPVRVHPEQVAAWQRHGWMVAAR